MPWLRFENDSPDWLRFGRQRKRRKPSLGITPSAAVVGIGLMAAASSLFALAQIHSPQHASKTGWYVIGIVLGVIGVVLVVAGAHAWLREWREYRRSPLEIFHVAGDRQCVQRREGAIELRIKVRNVGRDDLNHVRAKLIRTPNGHDRWLRIQHDNTSPFERSLAGEVLPAYSNEWVYFDVAQLASPPAPWADGVYFEYADEYLKEDSRSVKPSQNLTIRVWAARERDGRSVAPTDARFQLNFCPTPLLDMNLVALDGAQTSNPK